jgi:hypothetical protein
MIEKIKIFIDTGTWIKLDKLLAKNIINDKFITGLYKLVEIHITPQIEKEVLHFSLKSWQKERTYIIPITDQTKYERAIEDGFDEADSSLFGIPDIAHYIVVTEDRPLLEYGRLYHLNFVFFVEFLARLLENDLIASRELYYLNKELYLLKNIDKPLYSKMKLFSQRH